MSGLFQTRPAQMANLGPSLGNAGPPEICLTGSLSRLGRYGRGAGGADRGLGLAGIQRFGQLAPWTRRALSSVLRW